MKKTIKTLTLLVSGLVLLSCVVVVVNQTAGVVHLARDIHPAFGTVTLWVLLFAYGGLIAVPVVMVIRMPRPLVPPESEASPEFDEHIARLGERLAANSRVRFVPNRPIDRRSVEDALRVLDNDANAIVKQVATTVFLTTAVSQSGRLDALLVLAAQSRMVWRIAHLYYQRPSLRELAHLYGNVAATAFVAGELDDLELHQMIQPVVAGSLGAMGGAIPWLSGLHDDHGQLALERECQRLPDAAGRHHHQGLLWLTGRRAPHASAPSGDRRSGTTPFWDRQGQWIPSSRRSLERDQAQATSPLAVS